MLQRFATNNYGSQIMSNYAASVVIPTYNRWDSLHRTLLSLNQQILPNDSFEVIIVDDGSTEQMSNIDPKDFSFLFRIITQTNQGSAIARNTGANNAQGRVLIFLDDDMIVEPQYVLGLVELHKKYPKIIGMGTEIAIMPESPTTFQRLYYSQSINEGISTDSELVEFSDCVTNNLSVESNDFVEIGGMEDVAGDGPTWWGDVDFGYRAELLGYQFRRSGKALCSHIDYSFRSLEIASQRMEGISYMAVDLFKKYPTLQSRIPMFIDKAPIQWNEDHPSLIIRKVLRQISASNFISRCLKLFVGLFELWFPRSKILGSLYLWILGGHMFRGFRKGLKDNALS